MEDEQALQAAVEAIEVASRAWGNTRHGKSSRPLDRAAAIPATGILAAAILDRPDEDLASLTAETERALAIAQRAWEKTHRSSPGNPIAATAEKSVIGILAAGILRYFHRRKASPSGVSSPE